MCSESVLKHDCKNQSNKRLSLFVDVCSITKKFSDIQVIQLSLQIFQNSSSKIFGKKNQIFKQKVHNKIFLNNIIIKIHLKRHYNKIYNKKKKPVLCKGPALLDRFGPEPDERRLAMDPVRLFSTTFEGMST